MSYARRNQNPLRSVARGAGTVVAATVLASALLTGCARTAQTEGSATPPTHAAAPAAECSITVFQNGQLKFTVPVNKEPLTLVMDAAFGPSAPANELIVTVGTGVKNVYKNGKLWQVHVDAEGPQLPFAVQFSNIRVYYMGVFSGVMPLSQISADNKKGLSYLLKENQPGLLYNWPNFPSTSASSATPQSCAVDKIPYVTATNIRIAVPGNQQAGSIRA